MKFILSLAGLFVCASVLLTNTMTTMVLVSVCLLTALFFLVAMYYWGKNCPIPNRGQVGYLGTTKVTVLSVFPSFWEIPDSIRLIWTEKMDRDYDLTKPWVVAITTDGKIMLSHRFSDKPLVKNAPKKANNRPDRNKHK